MVLMKIKSDTTSDQITALYAALQGLLDRGTIPGLLSFSGGPYKSPEGLNKGFTHGFCMTFENAESRDNYLPHPDHTAVASMVISMVDDVIAFDYENF